MQNNIQTVKILTINEKKTSIFFCLRLQSRARTKLDLVLFSLPHEIRRTAAYEPTATVSYVAEDTASAHDAFPTAIVVLDTK